MTVPALSMSGGLTEYQIEESRGRLSGMYVWGDVAYVNGMFFSPEIWREHFKPIVKRISEIGGKNRGDSRPAGSGREEAALVGA
jgi:hypothetical protein